ncbi:uncharacterized protein LOC130810095 isoform X2 [Amaranthus tricolor]|uniref:uncharacterized protein LOC130810095 isoform X2 n=1 Tax=Amaranthus tricolor TaxID=29722 RepID=UPI00258EC662|nr:uncharacterized protein LOC130810095 isoform X2 [Amaranthus tricolor]
MSKSTLFIAVQCCECSTMQVKQQKKSSSKWNCVICNQKQSVTKIYAQSYQAKDIRKVVQSFNMSRKFHDEMQQPEQEQSPNGGDSEIEEITVKRRTDWSEFMEDDNISEPHYLKSKLVNNAENNMDAEPRVPEPRVVTELPEDLMFKKPKLKGKFGGGSFGIDKNHCYKPIVSKRGISTKIIMKTQQSTSNPRSGSVCDECMVDDNDLIRGNREQCEQQQRDTGSIMRIKGAARHLEQWRQQQLQHTNMCKEVKQPGASKWSKYMTEHEDVDNIDKGLRPAFADDFRLMRGYKLEKEGIDQPVEEDIHPDFL